MQGPALHILGFSVFDRDIVQNLSQFTPSPSVRQIQGGLESEETTEKPSREGGNGKGNRKRKGTESGAVAVVVGWRGGAPEGPTPRCIHHPPRIRRAGGRWPLSPRIPAACAFFLSFPRRKPVGDAAANESRPAGAHASAAPSGAGGHTHGRARARRDAIRLSGRVAFGRARGATMPSAGAGSAARARGAAGSHGPVTTGQASCLLS
jgi:hypothetical protein